MTDWNSTELHTEEAERTESPGMFTIALMFLSGVALFTAVIVLTTAIFYDAQKQEVIRKRAMGNLELQQLRQEQEERLSKYRWIDQSSGVIGIPLEQAIGILMKEMNEDYDDQTNQPQGQAGKSPR